MAESPIEVGSVVEGIVTGITKFGAFVQLPNGKSGLVHISEVADTYVHEISDYLKQRDKVKVKVLTVDDKGKISLSIRQTMPKVAAPVRPYESKGRGGPRPGRGGGVGRLSFEDKLARFMKESDERIQDLMRHTEGKQRGGRGTKRGEGTG